LFDKSSSHSREEKIYSYYGEEASVERIKEHYEKIHRVKKGKSKPKAIASLLKSTLISKMISQKYKPKALDIGFGKGYWTEGLRLMGCDSYGIDLSEEAVKKAGKAYPLCTFRAGDVLEMPRKRCFDILFSRDTSFYNGPILVDGAISSKKIWVTKQLLKLGRIGGLFILVSQSYAAKGKPRWCNKRKTWFRHTKREFEALLSLFGTPKVHSHGVNLIGEIYIDK